MANVTLDGVTKKFGDVVAVNEVSMEIEDKEFLVLVGPSGCGKSTLLRLVAGLEELTYGEVSIGGREVGDMPPKDRDIAMVFQSYALYPHMSVYDNLAFGLKLRKTPRAEIDRRVKEAARVLGITEYLKRKPREMSGGQRQRVALGRAIVREPKVFLMDEPLSNLDAKLRVQTRAELIKLHKRLQATVIYVTHDQVEAMTMGSRIAVLKDGLVQQLASPQQIYDRPANMFVAEFIGSPAMNFFPAHLTRDGDDALWAEGEGFRLLVPGHHAQSLQPHLNRELMLGIRPEQIAWANGNRREGNTIRARVDVVETLGSEAILNLLAGSKPFLARVPFRSDVRMGEDIELVVDLDRIHVFDPGTQLALN